MSYLNPRDAADLSAENFELALRAYVQAQLKRMDKSPNLIMLTMMVDAECELGNVYWNLGYSSDAGGQTKGEILEACCAEHDRRRRFTEGCTLRLIEAAKPDDDAIPF